MESKCPDDTLNMRKMFWISTYILRMLEGTVLLIVHFMSGDVFYVQDLGLLVISIIYP